jgi:hypothetical protein
MEIDKIELKLTIQDYLIYNKQYEDDLIAIANILGIDVKQFEIKE